MSKHPAGYYGPQPPIPPGHPPPTPAQHYDAYSTWSVAAAAAQQQYYQASAAAAASAGPGSPAVNPYANYGYGPAATWAHHPPPPPHHRIPAPPTPVPPLAQPYGPYIPQAQPQQYSPHNPATPYAPRQLPPPVAPSQPLPMAPRPFQQPPLKRQRVHSLQSNGSRFPPIPTGPARPPTDTPPPIPGLPSPVIGPNLRPGNAMSSRGRGHPLRPSRGGRGGGAPNRHGSGASRQSANTIPRGPRRGGVFPQATSRSFRSSSGGDSAQSNRGWSHGVSESGTSVFNSSVGASASDKEGKRTLTDFRIIGFGFVSDQLTWSWGTTRSISDKAVFPPSLITKEDSKPTPSEPPSPVKQEDTTSASKDKGKKTTKDTARIRIYFQPTYFPTRGGRMPPPSSVPSRLSAKRKKSDSEEDDGERANIKRHHGESEESPRTGILTEPSLPTVNGDTNVEKESGEATADDATRAQEEQNTDASSEAAAWMGQALKDLKEESEDGHEHEVQDDDDQNSEGNDLTTELVEGYEEEEEEEGTSLFGSGVHPSPPSAEDVGVDLIVQSVEEMSNHGDGGDRGDEANGSENNQGANKADGSSSVVGQSSGAGGPGGSSNKLSVSFASSSRRLVLDAETITYLKVFRAEGRIEFVSTLEIDPSDANSEGSDPQIKGVFLEVWSEEAQAFHTVPVPAMNDTDSDLPPLRGCQNVTFHVFLDMENPLSMPRWVKTGDVDDWLLTMLGSSKHTNTGRREMTHSVRGWEGKISVVDPDPALTLQNTLENWATNSVIAQQKDREQYLKSSFYHPDNTEDKRKPDMDNMMELLLRPIRGGQPTIGSHLDSHHHHHHNFSYNNSVNPVLQAAANSDSALISGQTHTSLAVLALFRVLQQTATKYGGDEALKEAEAKVRDIIQALPSQMMSKNLDAMFQRWNHSNTGAPKGSVPNGKSHR